MNRQARTYIVTIVGWFDSDGNPYTGEFSAQSPSAARYAEYRATRDICSQSFGWWIANTTVRRAA
jgi:hypothetical protein